LGAVQPAIETPTYTTIGVIGGWVVCRAQSIGVDEVSLFADDAEGGD